MALFGSGPRSNILQTVAPMYQGIIDAEKQKGMAMREAMGAFGKAIDPKTIGMRKFRQEFANADWEDPATYMAAGQRIMEFDTTGGMSMIKAGLDLKAAQTPKPTKQFVESSKRIEVDGEIREVKGTLNTYTGDFTPYEDAVGKIVDPVKPSQPKAGELPDGTPVMVRFVGDEIQYQSESGWTTAPHGTMTTGQTIKKETAAPAPSGTDVKQAAVTLAGYDFYDDLGTNERASIATAVAARVELLHDDPKHAGKDNTALQEIAVQEMKDEGKLYKAPMGSDIPLIGGLVGQVTPEEWKFDATIGTSAVETEEVTEEVQVDIVADSPEAKTEAAKRIKDQTFLSAEEAGEAGMTPIGNSGQYPENSLHYNYRLKGWYVVKNGYMQPVK